MILYLQINSYKLQAWYNTHSVPYETLDDQTQVDSKPAGQPEHASLNKCQLIAP